MSERPSGDKFCHDCGEGLAASGEYRYMVLDAIWREASLRPSQVACIGCLEARLGRKLVPTDFSPSPLNSLILGKSPRLLLAQGHLGKYDQIRD